MNILRRKSLKLTDPTETYKGEYLGNVSTNVTKGEHCTDKPMGLLWANYVKTSGRQTLAMIVTVDNSGLKVVTQTQGLTHYWCHRISYFCVSKSNPKLFVWIYRHVAKKLKVELRCHAILMKNEKKARSLVECLTEKVAVSLREYRREKKQKDRRRLLDAKAADYMSKYAVGATSRTKHLLPGKNYKPPAEYSLNSPSMQVISEENDSEPEHSEEEIEEFKYSTLGRYTMKNKFRKKPFMSVGSLDSPPVSIKMSQPDDDEDDDFDDISGFATLPKLRTPHHHALASLAFEHERSGSMDDELLRDLKRNNDIPQLPPVLQMPDLIISSMVRDPEENRKTEIERYDIPPPTSTPVGIRADDNNYMVLRKNEHDHVGMIPIALDFDLPHTSSPHGYTNPTDGLHIIIDDFLEPSVVLLESSNDQFESHSQSTNTSQSYDEILDDADYIPSRTDENIQPVNISDSYSLKHTDNSLIRKLNQLELKDGSSKGFLSGAVTNGELTTGCCDDFSSDFDDIIILQHITRL